MSAYKTCAYCKGTGDDRYKRDACEACSGSGTMVVPYDNAVTCAFCGGSGDDRYERRPCRVCQGAGVCPPGLQVP